MSTLPIASPTPVTPITPAPVITGVASAPSEEGDSFLWQSIAAIALLFLGSLASDLLGKASPALMILWVPLAIHFFVRAPPHIGVRLLLLFALVLEPPGEAAGEEYWTPALTPASTLFYAGMNKLGIPGMSLPLYFFLALAVFLRARKGRKVKGYVSATPLAVRGIAGFFFALLAIEIYGVVIGGSLNPSFFQLFHMLHFTVVASAFLFALRGPQDFRAIGGIVVVSAITKALIVAWVYQVVCRPMNIQPFVATTHSDSVTFIAAIVLVGIPLFETPTRAKVVRLGVVAALILVAIVMNNRRLAFVGVIAGWVLIFTVLKKTRALKRKLLRTAMIAVPILAAYVLIGGNSSSPIFAPAKLIMSVTEQKDRSAETRDIENYNLIRTMKERPLLGYGFGHEYIEFVQADDISAGFALYRYIAHNSVLWLWSLGGYVGFTGLWMIQGVAAYFAARAYHVGQTAIERAGGLSALAIMLACQLQAWGDMGICSATPMALLAAAYGVAAKVCGAADQRDAKAKLALSTAPPAEIAP